MKKTTVLFLLLLMVLFCAQTAFGQAAPKTALEFAQRGIDYLDDGEYAKALADFNQALRLEPNGEYTPAYYLYRGITYSMQKDYDKAIADFNQADKLEPNDEGVLAWRGNAYFLKFEERNPKDNGDDLKRRALADLNKAIQLNPDYAWAYGRRGYYYAENGNWPSEKDRALADYNKSIQLDPDDAEVYKDRGRLYLWSFDNPNMAIADYTRAINLDPTNALYYYYRAEAYGKIAEFGNRDYTRAIADYTQAIRLDPKDKDNYAERGKAYYYMNDFRNAVTDLEQAIKLWTGYKGSYYDDIDWHLSEARKKR